MKKEIEICDICKKVVAETKCEFCSSDLCTSCKTFFGLGTEDKIIFNIISCSNCNEVIQGIELEKEFKGHPDTRNALIEIFKRLIQLEELEGKVKKKKLKETYPGLFNRFYPKPGVGTAIYPPHHITYPDYSKKIYDSRKNHNFAWAASKAGKISRYKLNDDDKA